MKKYILMLFAGLTLVSCMDTIILPDDKTVDEDFWKSKEDVAMMVNGAYAAMTTNDVLERLIVWGDFRTDEVNRNNSVTDISTQTQSLDEIAAVNIQTTNAYATWSAFYEVINRCNIVLTRASEVLGVDPNYTDGDYQVDRSQMLALRALCYFYLVRNFRDVPYYTEAYMTSSQATDIPQSSPAYIINQCISDLEGCVSTSMSSRSFNDWRRVGYFTRDGIHALMADIYLWRASVNHSVADYEQAIAYCDKVIASKKAQHVMGFGETEAPEYPLEEGRYAFRSLYVVKNAEESIFELQYDGSSNLNAAHGHYLNHYNGRDNAAPYLYASDLFSFGGTVYKTGTYTSDWRALMNTYENGKTALTVGELGGYMIRKYVTQNSNYTPNATSTTAESKGTQSDYASSARSNYIVYRLPDIMMMMAEALTAIVAQKQAVEGYEDADGEDTKLLQTAFELVEKVNTRSRESSIETIKWNTYNTAEKMEALILEERLRELAFEGKRWYDLMRYNYRHVDGVDYNTILAVQKDNGKALPTTYQPMLDLMKRKLGAKGNAVAAKMSTEGRLYLPISLTELKVSPLLRQNPEYKSSDDYSKNY